MKTVTQVRIQFVDDHAGEFLARLDDRVATNQLGPQEANAYRARMARAHLIANAAGMMQEVSPGVWDVWSTGKDMAKVWTVDTTCNCPDADVKNGGKAPQGHCKHRLAVWLRRSANKDLHILEARMEGLKLPHTHTYECGHDALEACYDHTCTTVQDDSLCETCTATEHVGTLEEAQQRREDAIFGPEVPPVVYPQVILDQGDPPEHRSTDNGCEEGCEACALDAPLAPPAQYELPPVLTSKLAPLPEAPASLNLKFKKGQCEFMVTMRAHTDQEILERLPAMLKGLRDQLGITFTSE